VPAKIMPISLRAKSVALLMDFVIGRVIPSGINPLGALGQYVGKHVVKVGTTMGFLVINFQPLLRKYPRAVGKVIVANKCKEERQLSSRTTI
jgi:hypothetical protein